MLCPLQYRSTGADVYVDVLDIVWLKKDLRLSDHRVLTEAAAAATESGHRLLLLYLYEPSILAGEDISRRHLVFLHDCLQGLAHDLEGRGQRLYCVEGEAVEVFAALHGTHGIARLWSHQETGNGLTYERDQAVAGWCREHGVSWHEYQQHGVIRRLQDRDGWAARWAKTMRSQPLPVPELPQSPEVNSLNQMQSGTTGINSIRIYSPTKQVLDQDPQGTFIKQWVPELADVPENFVAEPWTMPELEQQMSGCVIGMDYPAPIVDHATVYTEAQRKIRSVRKTDTKAQRQKIFQKHGSRRRPGSRAGRT